MGEDRDQGRPGGGDGRGRRGRDARRPAAAGRPESRVGTSIELPSDPAQVASASWDDLRPCFEALASEPHDGVEGWLGHWQDFEAVLGEAAALASIRAAADVRDPAAEAAARRWTGEIEPRAQEWRSTLAARLLDSGWTHPDVEVMRLRLANQRELFRPENIPLREREASLRLAYSRIGGTLTAEWEGRRVPLTALVVHQQARDRSVRERAWRLTQEAWLEHRDELRSLFDQLLELRRQVAANAGFSSYREFAHRERNRFDYTPDDAAAFDEAVVEAVVPAAQRLAQRRQVKLGLDRLRPWDMTADPEGREPLKPYADEAELVDGCRRLFGRLDPRLGAYFQTMVAEGLLDLGTREGKRPGAFSTGLPHRRRAFVFCNAAPSDGAVNTMLHECGHAFHTAQASNLPYVAQRHSGIEFAEVASMSMELLGAPLAVGTFYSEAESRRSRAQHLRGILAGLPYLCQVDAFQHWLYTDPEAADPEARDARWAELAARFTPWLDYEGLEAERAARWYQQLHIWLYPFYYVEYAIARLGSLQVWRNSLADSRQALDDYLAALALGGTRRLPQLFERAGARLAWTAGDIAPLVELVEEELSALEG